MKEKMFPIKEAMVHLICKIDFMYQVAFYCPIASLLCVLALCKIDRIQANSLKIAVFMGFLLLIMLPIFAIDIIQDIHFKNSGENS